MKLRNNYYILRHGEALSNVKNIISCWPEKAIFPLTEKGRKEVEGSAQRLKEKNIDLIFASDILRTKQTAEIVSKVVKIKPVFDKRLREHDVGIFNNQSIDKLWEFFPPKSIKRFKSHPPEGETYLEMEERIHGFLKDINNKYTGKNILIISHELPLTLLELKVKGVPNEDFYKKEYLDNRISTGELRKLCN